MSAYRRLVSRNVTCPKCSAPPGEDCRAMRPVTRTLWTPHKERVALVQDDRPPRRRTA